MSKPVVLNAVVGGAGSYFSEEFRRKHEIRQNPYGRGMTKDELIKELEDVDAVVAAGEYYTKDVYRAVKKLKIVARYGVGLDNVDIKEATRFGILITYLPGINAQTVAEHAVALMFALSRKLVDAVRAMRAEDWVDTQNAYCTSRKPFDLHGKTLGIVGLGAIGSKVAKICSGLDLRIVAYDPYIKEERAKEVGVGLVSLESLLKESDVVSVHVPLTAETRHMIGERELRMMKRSAVMINTSRGAVIDEKALYRALEEGWISAAGLDVLEKEPPDIGNPLFTLENVIITPHCAGASTENFMRCDAVIEEQIEQALRGEIPRFTLNPDAIKYRRV